MIGLGPFEPTSYSNPDRDSSNSDIGPDKDHSAGYELAETLDFENRPFRDNGPLSSDDIGAVQIVGYKCPFRFEGV